MGKYLLLFNCILLAVSSAGGPLLLRLYFIHGGKRLWLSSWLETAGWPILFLPLSLSYFLKRRRFKNGQDEKPSKFFMITPFLFMASAFIGLLVGLDDYLYTYGVSLLPVSTSALIMSTHLAFTAGFALFMVKQKFTSYSVNAVILLTVGAILLGLHSNGDTPVHESNRDYYLGFVMTIGASIIGGLLLPLVELMYKKSKQTITYSLVIELQIVISVFATLLCTVGMLVNNDFKVIQREGKEYELGETNYYVVLVASSITWQLCYLGTIGVIFCSTSLLAGVIGAVVLPVIEILAVIFYHESFKAEKGIALFLSLWGFISYFYLEIKESTKPKKKRSLELEQGDLTVSSQSN
ncbi:hypothetical protein C5167_029235 [Papaver somniferum]|uniref:purine permease 3-like n=1 Tax=Papaver somniferum TaxID=3469 RepID=UPI000E7026E0|nr:purine permease 3-like [Papaver somniferum]XP_026445516.1 purine permease 3-like [Papaver somniferum]RZC89328.1 hypothetical protein C5167_029235 [Papaver somniferum]